MVKIAFYKAPGQIEDRLIRWRTGSIYSHCELVIGEWWYTSSPRDGGVRRKRIDPEPGHWDWMPLPNVPERDVTDLFSRTHGAGYDWLGVLVGQMFEIKVHKGSRWFCSEWCAAALGLADPWRYSPGSLAALLLKSVDMQRA